MKFQFSGSESNARSKNVGVQQCINIFAEKSDSGKNAIGLYGCPGTVVVSTPQAGVSLRGCIEHDDVAYWVAGTELYSMDLSLTVTLRGELLTHVGYVSIETNGLVLLIVDGTTGYTYTFSTTTFAEIADVDFPANPAKCAILDNTFVVINEGTQQFFTSADGATWNALDFASAESSPDNLISVIADEPDLLFAGHAGIEAWRSSSDPSFPFTRMAVIKTGIIGVAAICRADNSVFYLGHDKVVWRLNGYTPVRVSTHPIEFAIAEFSIAADCIMWSQLEEGHVFVWLQFPSGNKTLVYDVATGLWHRRAYRDPDTGALNRHRANCYLMFGNNPMVGDYENGNIYELDLDEYSDDGDELPAILVCSHIADGDNLHRVRHNSLTLDIETGVGLSTGQGSDPQIMLKWSDDAGHTWGTEVWRSMGAIGQTKTEVKWQPLGIARDRVYWAEITDPVKRVFAGAALDVKALRS